MCVSFSIGFPFRNVHEKTNKQGKQNKEQNKTKKQNKTKQKSEQNKTKQKKQNKNKTKTKNKNKNKTNNLLFLISISEISEKSARVLFLYALTITILEYSPVGSGIYPQYIAKTCSQRMAQIKWLL